LQQWPSMTTGRAKDWEITPLFKNANSVEKPSWTSAACPPDAAPGLAGAGSAAL